MKKTLATVLGLVIFVLIVIGMAGMYKFNFLASQDGYNIDGNNIVTVCDEFGNRYASEQMARDAGLEDAQFGATYCKEYKMHPSWDQDNDGLNDCENNGTCDHTVDYSVPRENMKAEYVGLTVEEAQILARTMNVPFRVVMKDGEPLPATMDYRIGRINAAIENNVVVSYDVEGQSDMNDTEILTLNIEPNMVPCVGVAPMQCLMVNNEYWYDEIEGFEFEKGFEYVLRVQKTKRIKPIPADASMYRYELLDIVSKQESTEDVTQYDMNSWKTMIPATCASFFDGCNTCRRGGGSDMAACTRMACQQYEKPKCLDTEA